LTIIVEYTNWELFACWINLSLYVVSLFLIAWLRYRQGKWKKIRVI
jgi:Na+-driven multidrug efflux pump